MEDLIRMNGYWLVTFMEISALFALFLLILQQVFFVSINSAFASFQKNKTEMAYIWIGAGLLVAHVLVPGLAPLFSIEESVRAEQSIPLFFVLINALVIASAVLLHRWMQFKFSVYVVIGMFICCLYITVHLEKVFEFPSALTHAVQFTSSSAVNWLLMAELLLITVFSFRLVKKRFDKELEALGSS